jgi:mannose-1-phosphate guanylyltransferase / mannose-6-phosphate isomerase
LPPTSRARAPALDSAVQDLDFCRLEPDSFAQAPSISLDHAVMERTDKAVVIPVDFAWSDIGAWSELWQTGPRRRRQRGVGRRQDGGHAELICAPRGR